MAASKESDAGSLAPIAGAGQLLTAAEFQRLAEVPPETEWFANLASPQTRRAYKNAVHDFMRFAGLDRPGQFRDVTRAHVIAWRDDLLRRKVGPPGSERPLGSASIRHRLAALSSLFEYLCNRDSVTHNPVKGVLRPKVDTYEGKTPAIGDHQARELLDAPANLSLTGKRDRAILATLLYHALRREELSKLRVKDLQDRRGVPHLQVSGKGGKTRWVPLHPAASALIHDYLQAAGHAEDLPGPLFRPLHSNRPLPNDRSLSADSVYRLVRAYSKALGFQIGAHSLRATAATNALDHQADIAKVQEWLGHSNIATTRIYDHRKTRPEDSPTFKVAY